MKIAFISHRSYRGGYNERLQWEVTMGGYREVTIGPLCLSPTQFSIPFTAKKYIETK
jgi:hypothetical protein